MSVRDGFISELRTEDDKTDCCITQNIDRTLVYVNHLSEQPRGKNFRHVVEIPQVIWEKAVQEENSITIRKSGENG